jgi:alkaline phosphatase D
LFIFIFALLATADAKGLHQQSSRAVNRLAFGSCLDFLRDANQTFWTHNILAAEPDLFVGLGDWMYADDKVVWKWRIPADERRVKNDFATQKAIPAYREFASQVPMTGIADDHDYGENDVNRLFSRSVVAASQAALYDFLDEPQDTDRRKRWRADGSGGMYQSYRLGVAPRRVHLILLDVRTFLDPWPEDRNTKDADKPEYDPAGLQQDILGEQQWKWLEKEISFGEDPEITIIASGLQIISQNDQAVAEVWSKHPQSQAKLLSLLAKHSKAGVFFISGDVHVAEVNRLSCAAVGYPLYEFTSSGLTHAWAQPLQKQAWYGLMHGHTRDHSEPTEQDPNGRELLYQGKNWGMIDIKWREKEVDCDDNDGKEQSNKGKKCKVNDAANTVITFEARGTERGSPLYVRKSLRLSTLRPSVGAGKARIQRDLSSQWLKQEGNRKNYSVLLGPESESEFRSALHDYHNRATIMERDAKEGGSLLPDGTTFPRLTSGASLLPGDIDIDLQRAIEECADSRLDQGHSAACRRVMHTCSPKYRIEHQLYYIIGHAAVLMMIWTPVVGGVAGGLWMIVRMGGIVWSGAGVAVIAGVLALLRKLL